MRKIIKPALKYIVVYIILIVLFVVSLTISSLFPSEWIKENVAKSANILESESNYKQVNVFYKGVAIPFDNYTDALMLNTAYSIDNARPLYSAFTARKNYIPGETNTVIEETAGELQVPSGYDKKDSVAELKDTVNGRVLESFEYGRYWHGYLTIIRPLLIIFNIHTIRVIFIILFVVLAAILLYMIYKKINLITAVIFLIGLTYVEYFYIGFSLQGAFVFFIMMISAIIILKRYDKIKSFPFVFFMIGMFANFFDLLTAPILTLGIPMIIYFLLKNREQELSIKEYILKIASLSIAWGIGYALAWLAKWALLDIIYHKDIFDEVFNQISYRSVGEGDISFLEVLKLNYRYVIGGVIISLIAIYIYTMVKGLSNYKLKIEPSKKIIPLLVIALIPFVWYFVLQNHSYYHSYFTYRNLVLTLIGIPLCILPIIKFNKKV